MRFVVAPGVTPDADTEEQLRSVAAQHPDAAVLAAQVVLPDGTLDPGSAPWPRILDKEQMIDAARAGLLAIRAAPPGALLVAGDVEPTLRGTAAALSTRTGLLVPEATATRATSTHLTRRARLELLAAPCWTREERLWQLFMLAR